MDAEVDGRKVGWEGVDSELYATQPGMSYRWEQMGVRKGIASGTGLE